MGMHSIFWTILGLLVTLTFDLKV